MFLTQWSMLVWSETCIMDKNKLDDYLEKKKVADKLWNEIEDDLINRACDILIWENENIGTKHDINAKGVLYSYDLKLTEKGLDVHVYISWAYGGYDEDCHFISFEKLVSDDWKTEELAKYQECKRIKEESLKKEKENKERRMYEELKKKYGN